MNGSPHEAVDPPTGGVGEAGHLEAKATIDFRHELVRKSIHVTSLSIPIIYWFITWKLALMILVPLALAFLATDLARYYHPGVGDRFYRWFGWLLRKHESDHTRKRLNGATNILLSAVLCVLIFPKLITITAFSILIISDTSSALIGRRFGRRRFFHKSVEGALAFFLTAVLVVFVTPKIDGLPLEYVIGIIAAAVGAITESLSSTIDDNIAVPLSIGCVMWGLYSLLLPGLDLYKVL
jgi:dolichol kinase